MKLTDSMKMGEDQLFVSVKIFLTYFAKLASSPLSSSNDIKSDFLMSRMNAKGIK
jgi:hypothetical protein